MAQKMFTSDQHRTGFNPLSMLTYENDDGKQLCSVKNINLMVFLAQRRFQPRLRWPALMNRVSDGVTHGLLQNLKTGTTAIMDSYLIQNRLRQ